MWQLKQKDAGSESCTCEALAEISTDFDWSTNFGMLSKSIQQYYKDKWTKENKLRGNIN